MRTKALFCGLSLMMAILGFVACTEEHVENITNEDNNSGDTNTGDETKLIPMTFTAVGEGCSRTELQPDNSVYWSPGDCICVLTKDNKKYKFVTDITEASPTASFHGEIEESDTYIAYYPYPKSSDHFLYITGNELTYFIPETQNAINGSFDTSLNPSLATVNDGNILKFHNLCSLVEFTFTGTVLEEVKKISITDRNNVSISGIIDYDMTENNMKARWANESSIFIAADKFDNGGTYYFVVPPVKDAFSKGFVISFYDENNVAICSKKTSTPINLASGKIIKMGTIEVKKDVDYEIAEDGTYLVYKASGLKAWADHVNAGNWSTNVTLMNDITFDVNEYWKPIGNKNKTSRYCGVIDGNGKTIKGLKIGQEGSTDDRNAFVMLLGENGVIKNLTVENPVCYGGAYASVLAGRCDYASSKIINCHVKNVKVECISGGRSGIICGSLQGGSIEGCTASGIIKGVDMVGGLVGHVLLFTDITCSSFEGTVDGDGNNYGGLVGYMIGNMTGCYAVASVTGSNNTGGLVGYVLGSNNSLSASYFKGSVTCSDASAGLIAGYVKTSSFGMADAYYSQDGGNVTAAAGNKIEFAGFKAVSNWEEVISDMNSKIGDTYKYKYVWDGDKQHPVLQATE